MSSAACPRLLRRRRHEWTELQREPLEMILEKLDLADHARFASVCSWWRFVAVENPPINKPLYLALSHRPDNLVRRFITSFIPNSWKEAWFIGAGLDGWLVILVDGRDLFLLNKGFNSIIPLPPLPKDLNFFIERGDLRKAVLSSPPPLSSPSSSSVECTVVIKHFDAGVLYCRLGSDKSFTKLSNCPNWPIDILFYEGRLYVLCDDGIIAIFDHLLNSEPQVVTYLDYNRPYPRRLLISGNNILSIVAGKPSQSDVFTLEGSEPIVIPVNNIRDDGNFQILLSNRYCSLSITAKDHKEFRRASSDRFMFGSGKGARSIVLDTSEDSNKVKAGDPWPLFFVMFDYRGIRN